MSADPLKRRWYRCCECGAEWHDGDIKERQGKLYGPCCMLKTAERRAFEKWFMEPNS